MLHVAEQRHEVGQRHVFVHRDDVGARDHNVADLELAEFEQVGQHLPLRRGEVLGVAVALFDRFLDALANLRRGGIAAHEGAQPLEQRLAFVVVVRTRDAHHAASA